MTPREAVLDAFRAACSTIDIAGRVRAAAGEPSVVIAAGKAATAMMAGVSRFDSALVVLPHGAREPDADSRVTVVHAAHPLPDASSVNAAERALAVAGSPPRGERLFLISGRVVAAVRAGGRAHPRTQTRGRRRAPPRGGDHHRGQRRAASPLAHQGRRPRARRAEVSSPHAHRERCDRRRRAGRRLGSERGRPNDNRRWPRRGAALRARPASVGRDVEGARSTTRCSPHPRCSRRSCRASFAKRGLRDATVVAAEPPLRVPPERGARGRCTHVAAKESLALPARTLFAAIATDGVDGSSGTGGAIVLGPLEGAREALERWDTGPLHIAAGTAIAAGPTGLNFADLHVRARY